MSAISARVRRLEAKAAPCDAIRVLVAPTDPHGAAQIMIDGGTRPATAAEIAGDGAGCVVWLDPADLNL
jgi:pentose-5-phosphate-3-epimerase